MSRKRIFLATGFVLLLGAGVAAAQVFIPGAGLLARAEQREQAFAASLALTPAQADTWQLLHRQRLQFALTVRNDVQAGKAQLKRDLSDPAVDLRHTLLAIQTVVDQDIEQHRALQEQRLRFYEQLNPEQQAKVRAHLLQRIEKFESIRESLLDIAATLQG